jgi:hypothetical protein
MPEPLAASTVPTMTGAVEGYDRHTALAAPVRDRPGAGSGSLLQASAAETNGAVSVS